MEISTHGVVSQNEAKFPHAIEAEEEENSSSSSNPARGQSTADIDSNATGDAGDTMHMQEEGGIDYKGSPNEADEHGNADENDSDDSDDSGVIQVRWAVRQRGYNPTPIKGQAGAGLSRTDSGQSESYNDFDAFVPSEEELKDLRFNNERTAFDVVIDGKEGRQPWRLKPQALSEYFNYEFNEVSWKIYCAEQLKLRDKKGLGPNNNISESDEINDHIDIKPRTRVKDKEIFESSRGFESSFPTRVNPSAVIPTTSFIPPPIQPQSIVSTLHPPAASTSGAPSGGPRPPPPPPPSAANLASNKAPGAPGVQSMGMQGIMGMPNMLMQGVGMYMANAGSFPSNPMFNPMMPSMLQNMQSMMAPSLASQASGQPPSQNQNSSMPIVPKAVAETNNTIPRPYQPPPVKSVSANNNNNINSNNNNNSSSNNNINANSNGNSNSSSDSNNSSSNSNSNNNINNSSSNSYNNSYNNNTNNNNRYKEDSGDRNRNNRFDSKKDDRGRDEDRWRDEDRRRDDRGGGGGRADDRGGRDNKGGRDDRNNNNKRDRSSSRDRDKYSNSNSKRSAR